MAAFFNLDIAEVPLAFVLSVVAPETGQMFSSQFTSYHITLSDYRITFIRLRLFCCLVIFVGLKSFAFNSYLVQDGLRYCLFQA